MNEIFGIYKKNNTVGFGPYMKSVDCFRSFALTDIFDYEDDRFLLLLYAKWITNQNRIYKAESEVFGLGGYILSEEEKNFINDKHLIGKYILVSYNENTKVLTLKNDKYGHFAVYTYEDENIFCFSSQYEPLLCLSEKAGKLQIQKILKYFYYGTTFPNETFFEEIDILAPDSTIEANNHDVSIIEGQGLKENSGGKDTNVVEQLSEAFSKVMEDFIKYFGDLTVTLTGGIDTRLMASCIQDDWKVEFVTFANAAIPENEDNEIFIAKKVAKRLNKQHNIVHDNNFPTPDMFSSQYFTYFKRADYRNVVSGVFGSEVLKLQILRILPDFITDGIIKNFKQDWSMTKIYKYRPEKERSLLRRELKFRKVLKPEYREFYSFVYDNRKMHSGLSEQEQFYKSFEFLTRSFFTNYYRGSRAGMVSMNHFTNNLLLPFIDQRILDIVLNTPINEFGYKKENIYNRMFVEKFNQLLDIPSNSIMAAVDGTCFQYYDEKTEPKLNRISNDRELYKELMDKSLLWDLGIFRKEEFLKNAKQYQWLKHSFIDFSIWLEYIQELTKNLH